MAVNYASKYSQNVDERFSTGSLTNGIVNGEFDWIGVSTVNVYSIPTSAIRYDMYSIGISTQGILGAIDFHGGRGTNITAPQKTLYEYFQDAVMASPNTPPRKTRDNGILVLRDFSLCGSDFVPHVVENMWMICSMPTALLTQRFIKLNGTKHMIIRSKKDNEQSWFLLANTGEEYTGSNEDNSW